MSRVKSESYRMVGLMNVQTQYISWQVRSSSIVYRVSTFRILCRHKMPVHCSPWLCWWRTKRAGSRAGWSSTACHFPSQPIFINILQNLTGTVTVAYSNALSQCSSFHSIIWSLLESRLSMCHFASQLMVTFVNPKVVRLLSALFFSNSVPILAIWIDNNRRALTYLSDRVEKKERIANASVL